MNDQSHIDSSQDQDHLEALDKKLDPQRDWTGSYFWPQYRNIDGAKKNARTMAIVILLFALYSIPVMFRANEGINLYCGLAISAVFVLSAVGTYFLYLPAAYLGAILYILNNVVGLIIRFVNVGFTQFSWVAIMNVAIFLGFYGRAINAVRQYREFKKVIET